MLKARAFVVCAGLISLALLLFVLVPSAARATSAVVPDQFSTIQAAINSGADSVLVGSGVYPESLSVSRTLALISLPSGHGDTYAPAGAMPCVTALDSDASGILLRGFRFKHQIVTRGGSAQIEGCWFEAGLSCMNMPGPNRIWQNIIFGDATFLSGAKCDIVMNTIIGGTLSYGSGTGFDVIHDNVVVGPAPVGIIVGSDINSVHNYVRGCTTGIQTSMEFSKVVENLVEDCSGTGIICGGNSDFSMGAVNNTVRRCGGVGIDVTLGNCGAGITGNIVDSVGSTGIRATGGCASLSGNTVRGAGGDGVLVNVGMANITGNVVGHSAGRGIVVQADYGGWIGSNTCYANGAAGLDISGVTYIEKNIAYGSGGYGLVWSGDGTLELSCNDWYENAAGSVSGAEQGVTDVNLPPLFCDLPEDNVYLSAGSPLLALDGCGLVGALGQGCIGETLVDLPTRNVPVSFALEPVRPNPSRGGALTVRFSLPTDAPARLELLDVAGRRIASHDVGVGQHTLDLGAGQRLAPGLYLMRLTQGANTRTTRVTVLK